LPTHDGFLPVLSNMEIIEPTVADLKLS
jgi:hypothetical protein